MCVWVYGDMGIWGYGVGFIDVSLPMIDDSLMNLGTWELGNLGTWELGNLGTWELGKLGT